MTPLYYLDGEGGVDEEGEDVGDLEDQVDLREAVALVGPELAPRVLLKTGRRSIKRQP